jgi:hypothetical protein
MQRKLGLTLFIVLFFLGLSAVQGAGQEAGKKESAREQRLREAEEQAKKARQKELSEKAMQELNKEPWTIYLVPSGALAGKAPIEKDSLTFSGSSICSAYLTDKGYGGSNFALSIADDGTAIWETMQRTKDGDLAFWRADLKEGNMRGIMGIMPVKKTKEGNPEFTFTNVQPEGYIEPKPAPAPAPEKKVEPTQPEKVQR